MLKPAIIYEDQLKNLFNNIVFDDRYKFYNFTNYYDFDVNLENTTWNKIEFVSVDKQNNVIGYLSAKIDRIIESVSNLQVINFYDVNITFSKDFYQFLIDLFMRFNFRKINFSVVVGNPAEKMYDKYVKKYGGRIAARYKDDVRLYDGKYYDTKIYEIMKSDFKRNFKRMK